MQTSSNLSDKPLGQILMERNIISQQQLDAALEHQQKRKGKYMGQILFEMGVSQTKINTILDQDNKRKPLSQVLLDLKILSPKELDALLEQQRRLQETMDRHPLGVLLVEMGYTTHEKYLEALSKHFNMPIISLEDFIPHPSLQKAIGEKYAQKHKIVVLENGLDKIKLAVAEPKGNLVYELRKIFVPLKTIEFFLAHPSQIDSCFHKLSNPFSVNQF